MAGRHWRELLPVAEGLSGRGVLGLHRELRAGGRARGRRLSVHLADLAAAYRSTGAPPIFDLNVMTSGTATTSGLTDQIQMLRTAQRTYDLPIRYLELGNEFYLCNTDYVRAFPTSQDYGRVVAEYVTALHHAFPGALIAAVGSVSQATTRDAGWNAGLFSVATGAGKPDAITLHDHPKYDQSLTTSGLPSLFTEPYTSAANLENVSGTLHGAPVWITEYSLSEQFTQGNPAQRTYANALFESEAALLLPQTVRAATLVDYWSSFGGALNYADTGTNPTVLTPVGLAMTWLDQAAHAATSVAPIVFSGGPTLGTSGEPALVGDSFSGANGRAELLVNLSSEAVRIPSGAAIASGAGYRQATGDPTEQVSAASRLTTSRGTVTQAITLAPYSLALVG
jgi:hypothetical protein